LSTAFHETIHWTGHPSRLDRNLKTKFRSDVYAFEELIAEMGAAFLGAVTCVPFEGMGHSEYIDSWLTLFDRNHRIVMTAAAKAQAGVDFLLLEGKDTTTKSENHMKVNKQSTIPLKEIPGS
jgi:antirestriction protein ArdC